MTSRLEVLAVASEVYPLIKTGGLADVAGALPAALKGEGVRVRTLVPGYPAVMRALRRPAVAHAFKEFFGGPARVLAVRAKSMDLLVLDAPHLFNRPGGPYAGPDGRDWSDNARRFAALARLAASIGQGILEGYLPDVIHAHDWQAGLVPAFLTYDGGPRPRVVMTVHNLAFQGQFDRGMLSWLGLPPQSFSADGVEYYGDIGFLKAGLRLADAITTVSPTYAAEICTPEGGMGLDGLLRGRADKLSGILNGIDVKVWDPAVDPLLTQTYASGDVTGRAFNKAALQAEMGLEQNPEAPLFGVVSRLSWQKGLDLLLGALPTLLSEGGQLVVLGAGDGGLEYGFAQAARHQPRRIACHIGYDEELAHRFQAGCDAILVPSRFEPCGLTQLCALRYGAVPVVARVGGLSDTVIDAGPMAVAAGAGTGVQFSPVNGPMLESAIRRAAGLYRQPPAWRRLQANGMASDVSWGRAARQYADLYRGLVAATAA
jgi:starch synthase